MAILEANGTRIHYTDSGPGSGSETIVFSHGLLFSGAMFGKQVEQFKDRYRCITFDHRGQGGSAVAADGYDMDTLTEDAAALIEALEVGPCHFAGLSMGGFVGMRLAIRRPELLETLMLLETTADDEPAENGPKYTQLNFVARWFGLRLVIKKVMPIMFSKSFMNDPTRAEDRKYWADRICENHKIGVTRAVKGVIHRDGIYDQIEQINLPTLIIVGEEDTATVPAKSERMHAKIKGSRLVRVPRAGHSSTIEEPAAVNAAIETFLGEQ